MNKINQLLAILAVGFLAGPMAFAQGGPPHGGGNAAEKIEELEEKVEALEAIVAGLLGNSVLALDGYLVMDTLHGNPVVRFQNTNVQVVNGLGNTDTVNELGNLIVGYDELRDFGDANCSNGDFDNELDCIVAGEIWALSHKSGSHNIVVGNLHNYSSVGGFLAGRANTINSIFASVSGGRLNMASGAESSVGGGNSNMASGVLSSVSGGEQNIASGLYSSVSGGAVNAASAWRSSVSGGVGNNASADESSVSGGIWNTASGVRSSVSGGLSRSVSGDFDWAAGGLFQDQ